MAICGKHIKASLWYLSTSVTSIRYKVVWELYKAAKCEVQKSAVS